MVTGCFIKPLEQYSRYLCYCFTKVEHRCYESVQKAIILGDSSNTRTVKNQFRNNYNDCNLNKEGCIL